MGDLIAIGEALVELNQPRDGAPFVQGFGGDTSNAMIAAARLGADAAYFTAVGADRFGQALTELWLKEGVDASAIYRSTASGLARSSTFPASARRSRRPPPTRRSPPSTSPTTPSGLSPTT